MRHLLSPLDFSAEELDELFALADDTNESVFSFSYLLFSEKCKLELNKIAARWPAKAVA